MKKTQKINYRELLKIFTSKDYYRNTDLSKPFKQNGVYCATDKNSMILIPENKIKLPFKEQTEVPIKYLMNRIGTMKVPINISGLENKLLKETCRDCYGTGKVKFKYKGVHRHYDIEATCPKCKGKSSISNIYFMDNIPYMSKGLIRLVKAAKIAGCKTITKVRGDRSTESIFTIGKDIKVFIMSYYAPEFDKQKFKDGYYLKPIVKH